jgi:hypothetical protein
VQVCSAGSGADLSWASGAIQLLAGPASPLEQVPRAREQLKRAAQLSSDAEEGSVDVGDDAVGVCLAVCLDVASDAAAAAAAV